MSRFRDQADTLRRLMRFRCDAPSGPSSANVVTLSSGKGGVGKTCIAANIGAILARSGVRTLLIDADLGLANLDIVLGVQSNATLEEVVVGEARLEDAVISVERNLWLLPASSGLIDLRGSEMEIRNAVLHALEAFPFEIDFILVDVGAGISPQILSMHNPGYETVVVATPEPTSLTDAYSLIKLLRSKSHVNRFSIVVNQVTDGAQGQTTFKKLCDVSSRFLDVQLEYLGHVARDEKVSEAVMKRKILLDLESGESKGSQAVHSTGATACLELICKRLRTKCIGLKPLTSSRFMDEPAQFAPGCGHESGVVNTTGFFRTLLGEVKA